jgi:hypothetical protein
MSILKKAPEGSQVLDLGAARAARAEARAAAGEGDSYIKLSAGYVQVLPEVPISVAVILETGDIKAGLAGLLADPADIDALLVELTSNDVEALVKFITGTPLGE